MTIARQASLLVSIYRGLDHWLDCVIYRLAQEVVKVLSERHGHSYPVCDLDGGRTSPVNNQTSKVHRNSSELVNSVENDIREFNRLPLIDNPNRDIFNNYNPATLNNNRIDLILANNLLLNAAYKSLPSAFKTSAGQYDAPSAELKPAPDKESSEYK